jgi:hypothetical protein
VGLGCWAANIHITPEEKKFVDDFITAGLTGAEFMNDYYSFDKEFAEHQRTDSLYRMQNGVGLLMREYGYAEDEAREIVRQQLWNAEKAIMEGYHAWEKREGSGPRASEIRRYIAMVVFIISGSTYWHSHAPRYRRADLTSTPEERATIIGKSHRGLRLLEGYPPPKTSIYLEKSPAANGDTPAKVNGDISTMVNGHTSVDGNGDAPTTANGHTSVEPNSHPSVEAIGNAPAEANGDTPATANGHTSVEPNSHPSVEAIGNAPAEANGYTPATANGHPSVEPNGDVSAESNGDAPAKLNGHTSEKTNSLSHGETKVNGEHKTNGRNGNGVHHNDYSSVTRYSASFRKAPSNVRTPFPRSMYSC